MLTITGLVRPENIQEASLTRPANPVQNFRIRAMVRNRSLGWVFVTRMIGILCFLIVVVLANILTYYVANPIFHSGVNFINQEFWLLVLISAILLVADLFGAFPFPLNLPAPIIKAIGSVFCIAFILRVFKWVDTVAASNLYDTFWLVSFLVVPLVFLLVLAMGYYDIMRRLWWQPYLDTGTGIHVVHEVPPKTTGTPISDAKSWEEIGSEFRMMLYDIIHWFRQEINRRP